METVRQAAFVQPDCSFIAKRRHKTCLTDRRWWRHALRASTKLQLSAIIGSSRSRVNLDFVFQTRKAKIKIFSSVKQNEEVTRSRGKCCANRKSNFSTVNQHHYIEWKNVKTLSYHQHFLCGSFAELILTGSVFVKGPLTMQTSSSQRSARCC